MDFFYNQADHVVDEALDGLMRIAPVVRSTAGSGIRVLVDRHWSGDRVAVISGGGAGHEPAHAGFVGPGMLAAAVIGDIFTSPSVEAVLAAIRACCGEGGCLLVIKNYTGDRLNFGLAAERAGREGYRVRTVIVADDISLPDRAGARGLAGTMLVHKIAGHLAASGADLDTVAVTAQQVCDQLCSMGIALSSATLPGHAIDRRPPELGLGIHNEPGVQAVDPGDAAEAMRLVLAPLLAAAAQRHGEQVSWVVLLNNLGGCASQEMGVLLNELLLQLPAGRAARIVVPAPMMTSMDMHGFSVTLLPATDAFVRALEAPVEATGWPGLRTPAAVATFVPAANDPTGRRAAGARDPQREQRLHQVVAAVVAARSELDALDARVGDGDTGTTFAAGARAIGAALEVGMLTSGDDVRLAYEIGELLAHDMGGSSGVLLSILATATGAARQAGAGWADALQQGVARVCYYGGAELGDRTLLDALVPAIEALNTGADLAEAARRARAGAEATRQMGRARSGRSAYVREDALQGITDPGAEAIARIWEAFAHG